MSSRGAVPLFDRRVPAALLEALQPGGPFHAMVDLVRDQSIQEDALDLQFRANPKRPDEGSATLYVGLTRALYLELDKRGRFRIDPQTQFGNAKLPVQRGWTLWQPREQLEAEWADVMDWIRDVIRHRPPSKVDQEGAVQAALASSQGQGFCVIDREAMLAFETDAARRQVMEEIRGRMEPVRASLDELGEAWTARETPFGNKLDALGLDANGRVLVVEVKPGSETGPLGWTPLQVAFYIALFRAWADAEPAHASEVLDGMVKQRAAVGLLPAGEWAAVKPPEFVPVIAVGGPLKNPSVANERMASVSDALSAVDPLLLMGLEVWLLTDDGAIENADVGGLARLANSQA